MRYHLSPIIEGYRSAVSTDMIESVGLFDTTAQIRQAAYASLKRTFDLLGSLVLLLLSLPILAIAALAVKLEDRGPILFEQERVGRNGRRFMCHKLRSMRTDAEKDGLARWASQDDPRITNVGKVIRKYRIDEFPQLVNVLRGDMSLVGPRPERPCFVAQLKQEIPYYDVRHTVTPGITGWAQVNYRYAASVDDAQRKLRFDLYYVKHRSILLDAAILLKTVRVVVRGIGAR
jgi:exopolysaccharide biosynthesis polyprenyl glycosylphosphotransferase